MEHDHYSSVQVGSWHTVSDSDQARLLSDEASQKYFEPFLARERSVTQAAEEVGCKLDAMHYRVRTFLKSGLLKVVREEARAGRPIKYYRSVADAFFVPFALTSFANLEESIAARLSSFNERIVRNNARLLMRTGREGRRLYRQEDGTVWSDAASDALNPFAFEAAADQVGFDFSIGMKLREADARELQAELHALFGKYTRLVNEDGQDFLWRVVLLPDLDDRPLKPS